MTALAKCVRIFGQLNYDHDPLHIRTYYDTFSQGFSLYDNSGFFIPDGSYLRGTPNLDALAQQKYLPFRSRRLPKSLDDKNYFWLGPLHIHFGHFLLSGISRLWPISKDNATEYHFLYTACKDPDGIFETDFMKHVFNSHGIKKEQLIMMPDHVRIPRLTVAQPAFVENFSINDSYRTIIEKLGVDCGTMNADTTQPVRRGIAYVSKSQVTGGVRGIHNELELEEELKREGISVHYPELMSFQEQIAFWRRYELYVGFAGSAFHMSVFSRGALLCTISQNEAASSNQVLLDKLFGNRHLYLHGLNCTSRFGPSEHFSELIMIQDVRRAASDLITHVNQMLLDPDGVAQKMCDTHDSAHFYVIEDEPFGQDLCNNMAYLRVSSGDQGEQGELRYHRSFGVIRTDIETFPQVVFDFKSMKRIYEVRIYHARDGVLSIAYLGNFSILFSINGVNWQIGYTRDESSANLQDVPNTPFRWSPKTDLVSRYMKIQLLGHGALAIDRVEVFGDQHIHI